MLIDQKAFDFIVAQEVTSPAYYERHYRRPEWPGGASGVTVACGYDLGYASPAKINADWSSRVTDDMLRAMVRCSGVKGEEARALLPSVRSLIDIPWEQAVQVFRDRDIPQWTGAVQRALPNTNKLSALCLGMHVATAYNRGAGGYHSSAPRFAEMNNICREMGTQQFDRIGGEFLSMRRLWPNLRGLQVRYTETSRLWNEGLSQPVGLVPPVQHDGEDPLHAGPARTKPPTTTPAQHTTTGVILAGTAVGVNHAAQAGAPLHVVLAGAVFGIVVAVTVWIVWYKNRNPK